MSKREGMTNTEVEFYLRECERPFNLSVPEPQPEYGAVVTLWTRLGDEGGDGRVGKRELDLVLALANERRLVNELRAKLNGLASDVLDSANVLTPKALMVSALEILGRATDTPVEEGRSYGTCPACSGPLERRNAVSRRGNGRTIVCPSCGSREALEDAATAGITVGAEVKAALGYRNHQEEIDAAVEAVKVPAMAECLCGHAPDVLERNGCDCERCGCLVYSVKCTHCDSETAFTDTEAQAVARWNEMMGKLAADE
jgi:hypothetical protein